MHFGSVDGRSSLLMGDHIVDLERASAGAVPADPMAAISQWDQVTAWVAAHPPEAGEPLGDRVLGAPVPAPRQVLAIGLNYKDHAAESGIDPPDHPATFTKFPSCITGPFAEVELSSGAVDWEAELVVVMGRSARRVAEDHAWAHVAGLMVGQDLTDRVEQWRPPVPQFSLGKSFPGFGPIGPAMVTPDELADPDDLAIECRLNGEVVQASRTSQLVFTVPELIARLSAIVTLLPGDLIFTGTPAGVGAVRQPPRFLRDGDVVETAIEGIGTIRNTCRRAPGP
jgi:2,4-diketo-3-deoxy-L-fuconate hydrolase